MATAVLDAASTQSNHFVQLPVLARWILNELFLIAEPAKRPLIPPDVPAAERLNVTLRHRGQVRGSMSGSGATLAEQLVAAVQRAAEDKRFGGLVRDEVGRASIEVWVQESSVPISLERRLAEGALDLGHEGVEVRRDAKHAYYKPSVALTSRFLTQRQMLDHLCKKAGLPANSWRERQTIVLATRWSCYAIDAASDVAEPIARLRRPEDEATNVPALDSWFEASTLYLVRNQRTSGEMTYCLNAITGKEVPSSPNSVRASGCFLALSSALANWTDRGTYGDLERATVALYRFIVSRGIVWNEDCRVILDETGRLPSKLGATALFACGLANNPLADALATERALLLNTLKSVQRKDGLFASHIGSWEIEERSANYYSGQALLALASAAEDGDDHALAVCRRGFAPYREIFEKRPTSAFVGWHIDAWSQLARITGNEEYAEFALAQADWLVAMQIVDSAGSDWVGGFGRNGAEPTASSLVFVEALCRAFELANWLGQPARQIRYAESIRSALTFCPRLRAEAIPDLFKSCPERSKGGILLSLRDLSIRCDFVQHFITMCLALKKVEHLIWK